MEVLANCIELPVSYCPYSFSFALVLSFSTCCLLPAACCLLPLLSSIKRHARTSHPQADIDINVHLNQYPQCPMWQVQPTAAQLYNCTTDATGCRCCRPVPSKHLAHLEFFTPLFSFPFLSSLLSVSLLTFGGSFTLLFLWNLS